MSYITYDKWHITKVPFVNRGVKSLNSTMQLPAPKLSKVHFNILNLENENCLISFVFSEISYVFLMWFESGQDHTNSEHNFRNLIFIYIVMTSNQKIKKDLHFWIFWQTLIFSLQLRRVSVSLIFNLNNLQLIKKFNCKGFSYTDMFYNPRPENLHCGSM